MDIPAIGAISASAAAERLDRGAARTPLALPPRVLLEALAAPTTDTLTRKSLIDLLSTLGNIEARVVEQRVNGDSVLEFAGARIVLRLPEPRALGESVTLSLAQAAPDAARAANEQLSITARLLAHLSNAAAAPRTSLATDLTPLSASASIDVPAVAQALAKAISTSGLFYESHLARWSDNDYALADIKREPQASVVLGGSKDLGPGGLPGELPAVAAERLVPLLREQLALLDGHGLSWRGQLWPGQTGTLDIEPEAGSAARTATGWTTRISLELPRLGRVDTVLSLHGQSVGLTVAGDNAASAGALDAARSALHQGLRDRGLAPGAWHVSARDTTEASA